jgi:hypothetical protein
MTVTAMKDLGFKPATAQLAGAANAAVDDKQGNSSAQANLHAMCGFGQPEYECRKAVAKIIADGKQESADAIADGDYKLAIRRMGETLHTIQDMAFHKFEPWPYAGIGDAILNAPEYMFCHLIRDLGVVSVSNAVDVEVSWRVGHQVYVGVKGFYHPSNDYFAPIPPIGGSAPEIPGFGGLFTITIGAAPGSVHVRDPYPDSRGAIGGPWSSMMSSGREDLTRAEDATEEFINNVRKDVQARLSNTKFASGADMWDSFVKF